MLRPTIKRAVSAVSSLGRCFALRSKSHLKLDKSPAVRDQARFQLQLKCNFDLTGSWLKHGTCALCRLLVVTKDHAMGPKNCLARESWQICHRHQCSSVICIANKQINPSESSNPAHSETSGSSACRQAAAMMQDPGRAMMQAGP